MIFQTLFFVLFTTLLIQAAALLQSWRQNPDEVGLRDWGMSEALMAAGSLLVVLGLYLTGDSSGTDTPFLALLIRNVAAGVASSGWLLAWLGIRRFYHRQAFSYWLVPAYGVVFTLMMVPGTHLPGWRIAATSLSICVFSAFIIWELNRAKAERNLVTHIAGSAMVMVIVSWLLRALSVIEDLHRASGTAIIDQMCIYTSIVMSLVFTYSLILLTNQRIHQRLRDQAYIDPLTGALNRRAFFEASKPMLAALQRHGISLAVGIMDIDHFKRINDSYGHAVGDQVLTQFANLAREVLRDSDLFARHGGEEFVILLQHSNPDQATQAIDHLREAWARQDIAVAGGMLRVTFSAGVSHACHSVRTLDDLLKAADYALYQAKNAGRNRTVVNEDSVYGVSTEGAGTLPSEIKGRHRNGTDLLPRQTTVAAGSSEA